MEPALAVGLVLLVVGTILLLQQIGVLDVDWGLVWPVLLIAAGLAVVGAALLGPRRAPSSDGSWEASEAGSGQGSGASTLSIPADGARRLELTLRLGAGRYRLAGGAVALVDVTASDPTIESRVDRMGEVAQVRLSPTVERWDWSRASHYEWRMTLARELPVILSMQAGAGEFELDLSDVVLASASVSVGAADLRVILPRPHGDVPIRVEGGAAQLTFQVPPGVEARVSTSGLLTTSGRPETPGYAASRDRVTVSVTGGIAAVRIV